VWGGAGINAPGFTRALVFLSRGGGDASVVREFDMTTRQFVADGFNLPEAKSEIDFEDDDTVLVGTDFGEGSLTDSGYPRLIKRWRRATALEDAETVFSGSASDVAVSMSCTSDPGFERTFIYRMVDFHNKETFELRDGELIRLDIPTDCSMAVHREWAMIALLSDWARGDTTYKAGSVLLTDYEHIISGTAELRVVFEPGGADFFAAGVFTGGRFLSIKLRDVATVVEVVTPGIWEFEPLPGVPDNTTTVVAGVDPLGDEIFLHSTGFDKPPRLLHGPSAGPVSEIKSSPVLFDADDLVVTQRFTASADGTRVPYFLVAHRDSTGPGPTLLEGYGAFRAALLPGYLGVFGRLWLARGGTYALANIRGGGEFGPAWHEQVLRENNNISAERHYPPVLITTSTRDDRVHPGHARKMAAALEAAGHDVLYYENTEGGHSGAANNAQLAFETAVTHEFLLQTLFQ
jgi:prolyl oligopeptidase